MAKAACVPVVVSAWECECRRCGHEWTVVCGCASVPAEPAPAKTDAGVIVHNCQRPRRCDNRKCRSRTWQTDVARKSGRPHGTKQDHEPFVYRTGARAWKVKTWDEDHSLWIESHETFATQTAAKEALAELAEAS